MFNSRDKDGFGTVNLASRPWNQPWRKRGFTFSGHEGPSFTCLRQTFRQFRLDATLRLRGTAFLMWNYHGALAPDLPQSNATLHPLMWTRFDALELSIGGWKVIRVDEQGSTTLLATGATTNRSNWLLHLERRIDGSMAIQANGQKLWANPSTVAVTNNDPGALGLWVQPDSHLSVSQFRVRGNPMPARLDYLGLEALLGAGENLAHWSQLHSPQFRHGLGLVSKQTRARVKWNVTGTRFTLWSPRGPDYGQAEIRLDGHPVAVVNLHADQPDSSEKVWTSAGLRGSFHAVVWQALTGNLPVDCLEVAE
jgi:hypothetical protein